MGTTIFETDLEPGRLIMEEFAPLRVRIWTSCADSVCVALVVPVNDHVRLQYDLPPDAETATIAVIVKGTGITGKGRRTVSWKDMSESVMPYYTGGATHQLLDCLSPVRADAPRMYGAAEWREKARAAAGDRQTDFYGKMGAAMCSESLNA